MKIDRAALKPKADRIDDKFLSAMCGVDTGHMIRQEVALESCVPWSSEQYNTQPFQLQPREILMQMGQDIAARGLDQDIILRPLDDGTYQILAGHNRVAAAKLVGLGTLPAKICRVNDEQALQILTNTNLFQRERLRPSEKAWAYRMRFEAEKRQGTRTDLTSGHCVHKLTGDAVGAQAGDSCKTVQRYIRLTYLCPDLLQMVDEGRIAIMAGVDLSYLSAPIQANLFDFLSCHKIKRVSHKQACALAAGEAMEQVFDIGSQKKRPSINLQLPDGKQLTAIKAGKRKVLLELDTDDDPLEALAALFAGSMEK